MTQHRALLLRTILAGSAVLCLAATPGYAQRGGAGSSGGGASHGGGGGARASGAGVHGGGSQGGGFGARSVSPPPAGFTGFHGGASGHPSAAPTPAPAAQGASSGGAWTGNHYVPAPSASPAAGRTARSEMIPAPPSGRHLPAPSGNERTWNGSSAWRAPPAQPPYPNRVALSSNRWMAGGSLQPVSAAPRAPGMPVAVPRAGSVAFASVRPVPVFRHSFLRFCNTGGFFFGFGRRHRGFNFFFTSGAPFAQPFCFFNGFTTVCTSQLGFSSPFGFSPFGFGSSFWGWPYMNTGYDYQTAAAPQPAEQQPENLEANEYSTWQPGTVPEPLPPEQANASPLILLVLKDGTVYGVTDYWLEGGQLHYLASYGGANTLSLDQLDLQKTVDENWKRGVSFVLRPGPDQQQP